MNEVGSGNSGCHFHLMKERVLMMEIEILQTIIVEILIFDDRIQLLSKTLNHIESTICIVF